VSTTTLLFVFLGFLIVQRLSELALSARNAARLAARGAREYGAGHYRWLVLLHTLFPIALASEVLLLGVQPERWAPVWLATWLLAQGLRYAAIRALGEHWNTRILVVPGAPLVKHGVYRWLRHPNYVAVVLELIAAPLMFGAWRTALVFSVANLALLRIRIGSEEQALTTAHVLGGSS
jgi:methyltransferase